MLKVLIKVTIYKYLMEAYFRSKLFEQKWKVRDDRKSE